MESVQKTKIEGDTLYRKVGNRYVPVSCRISESDYMTMQPGVWLVSYPEHGRSTSFIGKVSELEEINSSIFIALKQHQAKIISALRDAIEATRKETADGATWWSIDLWRITDAIFKVLATK